MNGQQNNKTMFMYLFVFEMQRLSFSLNHNHALTKGKPTVNSFPNL